MDDLVAFLAARLAEDEVMAREAAEDSGLEWSRGPEELSGFVVAGTETVVYDEGRPTEAEGDHIARHDPARVLAEVAAKRAILVQLEDAYAGALEWPIPGIIEQSLRHLAAVYSGHPDYRPEWKP